VVARYLFLGIPLIYRDDLLSILRPFAQGTVLNDEPTMAVLITYFLTQITLFSNINQIASFVTMTFLLTFMVVNLACFLLRYPILII
jgi:solute carrier family 12 (potassium/chloride transporters), member 9